jgi:hypothetical protein
MKMADGGYRPAYDVQFLADTKSQVIVGLDVATTGADQGQLTPMVRQLRRRYGRDPDALLADAGFLKITEIDELAGDTTLYLPVRTPEDPTRDPHQPLHDDSPAVAAWRIRMGTGAAREIYKDRPATVECVNAIARNRGLQRFGVRGPDKARAIALWFRPRAQPHADDRSPGSRSELIAERAHPGSPDRTPTAPHLPLLHRSTSRSAASPGNVTSSG